MKKLLILAAFLLVQLPLSAKFTQTPRVMNVTEKSFTVLFTTDCDALCWVEIAPEDGTTWYQKERTKYYQSVAGRYFIGKSHSVTVEGLEPGTRYRYRILGKNVESYRMGEKINYGKYFAWNPVWGKDKSKFSRTCSIKTLDSKAVVCRFSVVNDIHQDVERLKSLVNSMPKDNDFLVFNGDIVSYCYNIDTVLNYTFNPIPEAVSTVPVVYVRGNHEGRGPHWYLLPREVPTPTGEFYYAFRQGPAAFLVLDAGEDKPDSDVEYYGAVAYDEYRAKELEWIKKVVTTEEFSSAPQKICIIHVPTLANDNSWYSQKWITDNFTPVLEKAGIKLMISGHHHNYRLSKAGEDGSAYTVFVNDLKERLDVTIDRSSIHLKSYDTSGKTIHTLDL